MKVYLLLILLVFCSSCGLQEKQEEKVQIEGFNIIQEDRTINFVLPEMCLTSYKDWFNEMNDKGSMLNTNIYKVDHKVQFGNIKYLAMVNSNHLNNMNLWNELDQFLGDNCYGEMFEKVDAKYLFYKDQDLANIYELDIPITNIRLNGKYIEVYFDEAVLEEHLLKHKAKTQ